jgi:hypothetical protein
VCGRKKIPPIWITGPQSTNPKYLKNAKSEHLIGWYFLNLTNEIGLLRNKGFWLGANILRCNALFVSFKYLGFVLW